MSVKEEKIIEEITSDEKFLTRILLANGSEEVKNTFQEKGVNLSNKQVEELRKNFLNRLIKLKPLDDKTLLNISGGKNYTAAICKGGGYGGAYGMWVGAGIGAAAGVVDASIKAYKGQISSTWDFLKEAFKISVKASFIGGVAGLGGGLLSGTLFDVGQQGSDKLEEDKK